MARRTMTPARRKRRAIRAAVALPILLAALVLALDFPFLTARGALAATQARYGFGPGEVVTRIKDSRYSTYRYIVRCGDWYASCGVYRRGPLWRSGQLMAVESRPEVPLVSLIIQEQVDNSTFWWSPTTRKSPLWRYSFPSSMRVSPGGSSFPCGAVRRWKTAFLSPMTRPLILRFLIFPSPK